MSPLAASFFFRQTQQNLWAQPSLLVGAVGADLRTSLHCSLHPFAAPFFSWIKVWIPNCLVFCAFRFSQHFHRLWIPPMYVRVVNGPWRRQNAVLSMLIDASAVVQ